MIKHKNLDISAFPYFSVFKNENKMLLIEKLLDKIKAHHRKEVTNMNVNEQLKSLITKKYGTLKNFTDKIGIANSTFSNILRRGIPNANVHTIIKICKELQIDPEALCNDRIVFVNPVEEEKPTAVEDILEQMKHTLMNSSNLTINDVPATPADILTLTNALDVTIEVWKNQTNQMQRLAAYHKKLKKDDEK